MKIALAVVMIAVGTLGLQAQNGRGTGTCGTGTCVNSSLLTGLRDAHLAEVKALQASRGINVTSVGKKGGSMKGAGSMLQSGTGTGVCDGTGTGVGKKNRKGK